MIQLTMSGPERVFGIAIIPKLPVTFSRVMFAPRILSTVHERADFHRQEIGRHLVIARAATITAGSGSGRARDAAGLPRPLAVVQTFPGPHPFIPAAPVSLAWTPWKTGALFCSDTNLR
jgi:hypothetical protein